MMLGLGRRIGRYRVYDGHPPGANSRHLHAWSPEGRRVFVRLVEPRDLESLRATVERVQRIEHPAALPIVEWGRQNGRCWIVRPYCPGRSLSEVLLEGPLAVGTAVAIAAEIAGALSAAHARGVLARDLTPEEVLLPDAGGVVLPDLGFAPVRRAWRAAVAVTDPTAAERWAPELLWWGRESPASDVYALGALLRALIAGRPVLVELDALVEELLSPLPSERPTAWQAAERLSSV
jgi:serine/threonine protein kinase